MKIYTKKGDDGTTGLFGGTRVSKESPRVRAFGAVDELNAHIGVVRAQLNNAHAQLNIYLEPIQHELFVVGSHLSTPYTINEIPNTLPTFPEHATTRIESQIDTMDAQLPELRAFILPGGTQAAAHLHVARTVCRRAERAVAGLAQTEEVLPEILQYLNRLSDFLFVAARFANAIEHRADQPWTQ